VKDARPDSAQAFTFMTDLSGQSTQFTLTDDGVNTALASKNFSVMPGSYKVMEGSLIGWTLSSIKCTGTNGSTSSGTTVALRVAAGDNITCTFVNEHGSVLGSSTTAVTPTPTTPELVNTGETPWLTTLIGLIAILLSAGMFVVTRKQQA
jgi:LPXTG-motif cell wall-anchored protein